MREAFKKSIRSEKRLREVVTKSVLFSYKKEFTPQNFPHTSFIQMCQELGGIIERSVRLDEKGREIK